MYVYAYVYVYVYFKNILLQEFPKEFRIYTDKLDMWSMNV